MNIEGDKPNKSVDLEDVIIDFNFKIRGEDVHPSERQMIAKMMDYIVSEMHDMHQNFAKQTKLLIMVKEFHEERSKEKNLNERKETEDMSLYGSKRRDLDCNLVFDEAAFAEESERVHRAAVEAVESGRTAVVYTRRELIDFTGVDRKDKLRNSTRIWDALTGILRAGKLS